MRPRPTSRSTVAFWDTETGRQKPQSGIWLVSCTVLGCAASGGALAPEPPRATRNQPESIRIRATPGINSLGCPLEVLPVQGRRRRVYQLSLGCQTTHDGIREARCFYFEPKCHEQCESKVLCLYLVIIWYFVVPK